MKKKPILIVIPYCKSDYAQALGLVEWIGHLGGTPNHEVMLLADIKVPTSHQNFLANVAKGVFKKVYSATTPRSQKDESWPLGPNWMFQTAILKVKADHHCPFFWMEPDCVPLKPKWMESLEEEYYRVGKPFMGAIVHSSGRTDIKGDHMTGVAIYPEDAYQYLRPTFQTTTAFDMAGASIILPKAHNTRLHQHYWGSQEALTERPLPAGFIRPDALVFHRDKLHRLVQYLKGLS